jgi:hypothetical protein
LDLALTAEPAEILDFRLPSLAARTMPFFLPVAGIRFIWGATVFGVQGSANQPEPP